MQSSCELRVHHMCHQPFRRGQAVGVEAITSRLGSKQAPGSKALSRRAAFRPALDEEGAPHQRTRRLQGQLTASFTSRNHG